MTSWAGGHSRLLSTAQALAIVTRNCSSPGSVVTQVIVTFCINHNLDSKPALGGHHTQAAPTCPSPGSKAILQAFQPPSARDAQREKGQEWVLLESKPRASLDLALPGPGSGTQGKRCFMTPKLTVPCRPRREFSVPLRAKMSIRAHSMPTHHALSIPWCPREEDAGTDRAVRGCSRPLWGTCSTEFLMGAHSAGTSASSGDGCAEPWASGMT